MIYNLCEYVRVNLPDISIVCNGWSNDSPQDSATIEQSGGDVSHFYLRSDPTVQVLSRAGTTTIAYKSILDIFNLLKNKYGLLLPSVTVDGVFFDEIKTFQISPIQEPGYIGADDNNLEMWSYNMTVTTF